MALSERKTARYALCFLVGTFALFLTMASQQSLSIWFSVAAMTVVIFGAWGWISAQMSNPTFGDENHLERMSRAPRPDVSPFWDKWLWGTWALIAVFYLVRYGSYGLWDPWETHYGEVAREVVARRDWISLWWAHEQWFWSKPIFIFWTEALSLLLLNVRTLPGEASSHIEWAIRLPHVALALASLLVTMHTVRSIWNARAAIWVGWVLGTTPMFALIGHQAITDMPFVSTMLMAMCMFLRAWNVQSKAPIRPYPGQRWSLLHTAVTLVLVSALPQVLYLISRNVTINLSVFPFTVVFHNDTFLLGSANNPSVPGNPGHTWMSPYWTGLAAQPWFQAVGWAAGLGVVLFSLMRDLRERSMWLALFYIFCAWSFMAKGLPGIVLPAMVIFFALFGLGRWGAFFEGDFRVGRGLILVAVIGGPWVTAMYVRHGPAFFDRLLIHDHINRLATGVHGDTGSARYFIQQLGLGLFPWVAALPWAAWALAKNRFSQRQREIVIFFVLWFGAAFALFSVMITKFHHYIFPAVPPLAVLIGLGLCNLWQSRHENGSGAVAVGISAFVLSLFIGRDVAWKTIQRPWGYERFMQLFTYLYDRPWPEHLDYSNIMAVITAMTCVSIASWSFSRLRGPGMLGFSLSAGLLCVWLLQVYMPELSPHWSQRPLIRKYYRMRHSSSEPLLAWQMNWKGENLYTGNRVYTFVEVDNVKFLKWIRENSGKKVFLILEHERLRSLKSVVSPRAVKECSTARDNNKFVLVSMIL